MLGLIERTLDEVLPAAETRPSVLSQAMRYAVGTGGKRIRPLVCLASAEAVGGRMEDAKYPAAAIELLHNYTLIHDDLPAMDNDVTRRGKPTVWVKFGEANAILAGDALLSLAFRVAAKAPRKVAKIVEVLGEMGVGVVAGQVEDVDSMLGQRTSSSVEHTLGQRTSSSVEQPSTFIYRHKTADLFMAAAMMGGYAGGGTAAQIKALGEYALNLGLAFQYTDDLLDGDGLYSVHETMKRAKESTRAAIAALEGLPGDTKFLCSLARKLLKRKI